MQALLGAGADAAARNKDGKTAADLAARSAASRLLAEEATWASTVGAPRSCHVVYAGPPPARDSI